MDTCVVCSRKADNTITTAGVTLPICNSCLGGWNDEQDEDDDVVQPIMCYTPSKTRPSWRPRVVRGGVR